MQSNKDLSVLGQIIDNGYTCTAPRCCCCKNNSETRKIRILQNLTFKDKKKWRIVNQVVAPDP